MLLHISRLSFSQNLRNVSHTMAIKILDTKSTANNIKMCLSISYDKQCYIGYRILFSLVHVRYPKIHFLPCLRVMQATLSYTLLSLVSVCHYYSNVMQTSYFFKKKEYIRVLHNPEIIIFCSMLYLIAYRLDSSVSNIQGNSQIHQLKEKIPKLSLTLFSSMRSLFFSNLSTDSVTICGFRRCTRVFLLTSHLSPFKLIPLKPSLQENGNLHVPSGKTPALEFDCFIIIELFCHFQPF